MVGEFATTIGSSTSSREWSSLQKAMLKVIGTLHRLLYRCSSGRSKIAHGHFVISTSAMRSSSSPRAEA